MIDDFKTIPVATNYEINSQKIVRNKSSGKIINPFVTHGLLYFSLKLAPYKHKQFPLHYLYSLTFPKPDKTQFFPIPSLGGKYEISRSGVVRNSKFKRIISFKKTQIYFSINGKHIRRSKHDLLWEVFGFRKKSNVKIPVILSKGNQRYFFDSLSQAAFFLQNLIHYSVSHIKSAYFTKRKADICGWHINYQI